MDERDVAVCSQSSRNSLPHTPVAECKDEPCQRVTNDFDVTIADRQPLDGLCSEPRIDDETDDLFVRRRESGENFAA